MGESGTGTKRVTAELLDQLLASTSAEAYLASAGDNLELRKLSDYINELLVEKGLTRAEVFRAGGINPTYGYDAFSGKRENLSRDQLLMLAFGLGCTLPEAQRMLRLAGSRELWPRIPRDAIIIRCLEAGFTREQTDDELFRLGEKTIIGA